jgi:hypothetical protein
MTRSSCNAASPRRGSPMPAPGIARGRSCADRISPERQRCEAFSGERARSVEVAELARVQTNNHRRRNSCEFRYENASQRCLKGRHQLVSPFQGSSDVASVFPGRCPGLTWECPFRAQVADRRFETSQSPGPVGAVQTEPTINKDTAGRAHLSQVDTHFLRTQLRRI